MKIAISKAVEIERVPIWFCSWKCEYFQETDDEEAFCFLFDAKNGEKLDCIKFPSDTITIRFKSLLKCSYLKEK